jgi:hypothetical protein
VLHSIPPSERCAPIGLGQAKRGLCHCPCCTLRRPGRALQPRLFSLRGRFAPGRTAIVCLDWCCCCTPEKASSAPPATRTTWHSQQLAPACPAESGALPRIVPASRSTCLGKLEICSAPLHQTAITALGKNHQDPVPPRPRPSLPTHVTPHRRPPTTTPLPFFGPRISLLTISPPCPIHSISQHPRECHFVREASLFGTSLARIPRSTPPTSFRYHQFRRPPSLLTTPPWMPPLINDRCMQTVCHMAPCRKGNSSFHHYHP